MSEVTRRYKLVSYRKQKSWSQKDVVSKLFNEYNISISESYYGMIEQGVRTLKRIGIYNIKGKRN